VTFLFTDIECSTRRWEADPEAMRTELAAHDDALRAAVEAVLARDAAVVEAVHGDLSAGLELSDTTIASFHECVARGTAMELADAARYAQAQIRLIQSELRASS
jgi:hypothetical protein